MRARISFAAAVIGAAVSIAGVNVAEAQQPYPYTGSFIVSCENGASYKLNSGPVTASGDVVTGYLHLSPRHAVHVRLIPMGVGYRYAGRGVWLDGVRDRALLYLRRYEPVACTVAAA